MAAKSKFFRVLTEGATTDGRKVEHDWIEQMAKNFDRTKYGARVWLEHIRGTVPGGPFDALGDVIALKAEKVEDGKMALFAQIEPLPALIELNKRFQKIYTSAEVDVRFADTGQAYLTGLAVTDTPASLGTEILQFAATHAGNSPFSKRKSAPEALFTEAVPFTLEIEPDPAATDSNGALQALLGMFSKLMGGSGGNAPSATSAAPVAPAPQGAGGNAPVALQVTANVQGDQNQFNAAALAQLGAVLQTFAAGQEAMAARLAALKNDHDALVTKLSSQPAAGGRPTATGGNGSTLTDC